MTKRYLESLPEAEQKAIMGEVDADYEAWWSRTSEILGLSPDDVYADGDESSREWAEALATETGGDEQC